MLQYFIQKRVASIGFHLGREAAEGQKFNKPLRLFLKDDSNLNYIQPFKMSKSGWRRSLERYNTMTKKFIGCCITFNAIG